MSRYVMDRQAPEETRRLTLLEAWADPGTTKLLAAIGVRPGWACLEVGAGAGSIARWLCERVGPEGHVVATDTDCSLLESDSSPNLEVRQHDIVSDSLPENAFDLVHARMVLEHLPEREDVLHTLVSSVKRGGWLVVEDQDIASVAPAVKDSPSTNSQFMMRSSALVRLLTAVGVDLEYGRRLYSEVRSQGLIDVCAEGRISVVTGGAPLAQFWRLTWEQLRPRLIGSGLLSEWDVSDFIELLDDSRFAWMSPMIMAAWGRRPIG